MCFADWADTKDFAPADRTFWSRLSTRPSTRFIRILVSKRPPRDKLLAEWFWTDRWQGSSGFLLPLEARGLYREMLTQAWQRGGRLRSTRRHTARLRRDPRGVAPRVAARGAVLAPGR